MNNYFLQYLYAIAFTTVFATAISEQVATISIPNEYIGATSLLNNGIVLFAGGYARFIDGPASNVKNVDIYNYHTNSWSTAELSFGRFNFGSASLHNKGIAVFAGGAYTPNGDKTQIPVFTNIVDIYDANTNTWTVSYLSTNRTAISATSLELHNLFFFSGGYISSDNINLESLDVIDILNFTSMQWTTAKLNFPNYYIFSTSLSSFGLAFMGGGVQKTLSIYNANSRSWSEKELSFEVFMGASASLDSYGLAFFAGGSTPNYVLSKTVDIFNAITNTWLKSSLSSFRAGLAATSLDKYGLVFFGGGGNNDGPVNIVDIYDAKSSSWSVSYLKTSKTLLSATALNELVFFVGGYSSVDIVDSIDIFAKCKNSFTTINPILCNTCPFGHFCNYQIDPLICPKGAYCGINVSVPSLCSSGTYNDVNGGKSINDCKKCPIGRYNSNLGATSIDSCLNCQYGTYCPEGSIIAQPCPENHFCTDATVKTTCPFGTYLDETYAMSVTKCKPCLRGHFCDGKGTSPVPCLPGTFSKDEGTGKCEICPPGYACIFGTVNPIICEKNFIAKKGSSACTNCPSGSFTNAEGETDCTPCGGNQFDISGWWCMSSFERILFLSVWGGTILSAYATLKKLISFIYERLDKIKKSGMELTIQNFIYIKQVEEQIERNNAVNAIAKKPQSQYGVPSGLRNNLKMHTNARKFLRTNRCIEDIV